MVTHLLGWDPLVVIAVMRLSSSSRFSWKLKVKEVGVFNFDP